MRQTRRKIGESSVDESISNLVHYHKSKLLRSQRRHNEAISEIRKASSILAKTIAVHPTYLPRYSRNIILNKGEESELLRLNGKIGEAITLAEEMLMDIESHSSNDSFVSLDTKPGFCSAKAWAFCLLLRSSFVC